MTTFSSGVPRSTCTRTNWPSLSTLSGLGMTARTRTVSVARLTVTSTKSSWPVLA
jgi:hypothetical protein